MKFKVGDSVRILNAEEIDGGSTLTDGKIYKIERLHGHSFYIKDDNGDDLYLGKYEKSYYEILSSKPTKNQRITALEKEVAELKTIVHQLRESNITIDDVKRHFNIKATTISVECEH